MMTFTTKVVQERVSSLKCVERSNPNHSSHNSKAAFACLLFDLSIMLSGMRTLPPLIFKSNTLR